MLRKLLYVLIIATLNLSLLTGCGSDDDDSRSDDGRVGRSYVYGMLDGALAAQLLQTFAPRPWRGETNGVLLLSADSFLGLSETQKTAARAVITGGQHAVLVTSSRHHHVEALHALTGTPPAIALDRMPADSAFTEVYGFAQPNGLMRMMATPPFPALNGPEPDSSKQERADFAATWILEKVRGIEPSASANRVSQSSGPTALSFTAPPWQIAFSDTMSAYWSTCGTLTKPGPVQQCVNTAKVYLSAWMVYSADAAPEQPTDYFIMRMFANLNTAGCQDFYGNRTHSTRIAGYWLRQANMSAAPPGITFDQMDIGQGFAPVEANPSSTVAIGTTWSLSGTGTAGLDSDGPSASLAFGGGVSYSDTNTTSYDALQTQVNIGATDNAASWTYDSWDFVHANIEPANHACGGPGLNTGGALPSIIYGGDFSPVQSWVWQAQPAVRQQFADTGLPVIMDTSLLLGWTYYGRGAQTLECTAAESLGSYYLQDTAAADIVGVSGSSGNGLNFDVSCGVTTNYGTIPLGPPGPSGQDNVQGNPGAPYAVGPWAVNVPFAPTFVVPTLTTLSPTSGTAGTVVTLTGTHLNAVTTVNFGGTSIPNSDFAYANTTGTIQVAAPKGKDTVQVSVGNPAGASNSLSFTYTR